MMMMIIRGRSMMTTTLARRLHIVSQNQPRNAPRQDAVAVPDRVDSHTPATMAYATPAAVVALPTFLMAALVRPPPNVRPAPAGVATAATAKARVLAAQIATLTVTVGAAPPATFNQATNAFLQRSQMEAPAPPPPLARPEPAAAATAAIVKVKALAAQIATLTVTAEPVPPAIQKPITSALLK